SDTGHVGAPVTALSFGPHRPHAPFLVETPALAALSLRCATCFAFWPDMPTLMVSASLPRLFRAASALPASFTVRWVVPAFDPRLDGLARVFVLPPSLPVIFPFTRPAAVTWSVSVILPVLASLRRCLAVMLDTVTFGSLRSFCTTLPGPV